MPQNFYELVWIFIIYAFIGWCTEVSYAALDRGIFVNRGFLNGPYCPIYGCGVVIVVAALTPLKDNLLMRMFRLYMLIGGMPQAVEAYLEHNNPKGDKINPIEVKSGNYRGHKSLDVFCDKYSSRIRDKYVVHTKDYKWENGIHYLPVYMIPFL